MQYRHARHLWRSLSFAALVTVALASCAGVTWDGLATSLAQTYAPAGVAKSETVCVRYWTSTGWSKGYHVDSAILNGVELNRRTRTRDYTPYSTYVVVFWAKDQASILELAAYFGSISMYGQDATDQEGREWRVSKTSYCR